MAVLRKDRVMSISISQLDTIGRTPLLRLERLTPAGNLFAKIESFNPLGSVKDRTAFGMIRHGERSGALKKGDTLVETTSGNTGIGLAWIARLKGYKLVLTMPESMSVERRKILAYLGAEIVLTPKELGMQGSLTEAEKIAKERGGYLVNQFANPGNPEIHFETTGPELYAQMDEKIDYAVFGVGTGGTLTGAGGYLKTKNPRLKIIAVEPAESPLLSTGKAGSHGIQGIGANFIPPILDRTLIDEVICVSTEEALASAREVAAQEGIFVGISAGAAAAAALQVARRHPTARVVTIFPDTAERYLSTGLFAGE